jgi:hypothetical protein
MHAAITKTLIARARGAFSKHPKIVDREPHIRREPPLVGLPATRTAKESLGMRLSQNPSIFTRKSLVRQS